MFMFLCGHKFSVRLGKYQRAWLLFCLFIYFYGCVGSSFLCEGFLQLRQVGATPHRGARASHHRGFSCCGAQAPDAQAQQLWLTGPVAPRHMGSSQTRARTRILCIGRQILNHCATREAPWLLFCKVRVCLVLEETAKLSSKVAAPFCIPASNEWEFLLLHFLASIWCCHCFRLYH